jgi:acetylornithine deacetylase/succinyl-diaminopimelate desuccinylase-like protein
VTFDSYIAEHGDRMVASLEEFVAIPSVSTSGADMSPAVDFLQRELAAAGFSVDVLQTDGNPVVYGEAGPADGAYDVLVYGHYDVFPADDASAWNTPPFIPTRVDGRMYGRGTGDNKGQLLAHVNGVRMLRELAGELPGRVKMIIEGEEEIGSRNLPHVAERNRERFAADLCFYSDGPMFPSDQPVILFGVRGAVVIELVARGARRVLHSGNFGGAAPAPALELCRLLASMVDRDGNMIVDGINDGVPPVSDAERAALAALPAPEREVGEELGVPPVTVALGQNLYERLQLRPNFNICGIASGWAGEGVRPIIPNEARAKVDIRLVGDQDPRAVVDAIRRHIDAHGFAGIDVDQLVGQPASKTRLDHPYVPLIQSAVEAGFGSTPLLVPGLGGTTPEYVFTKLLGLPTFSIPYAPYDESNHAANESTKLSLYFGGVKTTATLLTNLAAPRS